MAVEVEVDDPFCPLQAVELEGLGKRKGAGGNGGFGRLRQGFGLRDVKTAEIEKVFVSIEPEVAVMEKMFLQHLGTLAITRSNGRQALLQGNDSFLAPFPAGSR